MQERNRCDNSVHRVDSVVVECLRKGEFVLRIDLGSFNRNATGFRINLAEMAWKKKKEQTKKDSRE